MLRTDQEYSTENSWTGYKWNIYQENAQFTEEESGWFTARIPIMDSKSRQELLSIYLFDNEMWECSDEQMPGYNCINSDAISWYQN